MNLALTALTRSVDQTVGLHNLGTFPRDNVYSARIHDPNQLTKGDRTTEGTPKVANSSIAAAWHQHHEAATISQVTQSSTALGSGAASVSGVGLIQPGNFEGPPPSQLDQFRHHPASNFARQQRDAALESSPSPSSHGRLLPAMSRRPASAPCTHCAGTTAHGQESCSTNFCRHWCRHGTCKWGMYCRYTHSMPTQAEDLARVGLKEFPPWWMAAMNMTLGGGFGTVNLLSPSNASHAKMGIFGPDRRQVAAAGAYMGTATRRNKGREGGGLRDARIEPCEVYAEGGGVLSPPARSTPGDCLATETARRDEAVPYRPMPSEDTPLAVTDPTAQSEQAPRNEQHGHSLVAKAQEAPLQVGQAYQHTLVPSNDTPLTSMGKSAIEKLIDV